VKKKREATRADGSPCRAFASGDGRFCINHDPENAAAMAVSRRLGGHNSRRPITLPDDEGRPPLRLRTRKQIIKYLEKTIDALEHGRLDPRITGTVATLISTTAKLVQGEELQALADEIARMKAALLALPPSPGWAPPATPAPAPAAQNGTTFHGPAPLATSSNPRPPFLVSEYEQPPLFTGEVPDDGHDLPTIGLPSIPHFWREHLRRISLRTCSRILHQKQLHNLHDKKAT
jgi:hypothetical protein